MVLKRNLVEIFKISKNKLKEDARVDKKRKLQTDTVFGNEVTNF